MNGWFWSIQKPLCEVISYFKQLGTKTCGAYVAQFANESFRAASAEIFKSCNYNLTVGLVNFGSS